MITDHRIKLDGKWYKAGEDVPALGTTVEKKTEPVIEKVEEVKVEVQPEEPAINPIPVKKVYNRKK